MEQRDWKSEWASFVSNWWSKQQTNFNNTARNWGMISSALSGKAMSTGKALAGSSIGIKEQNAGRLPSGIANPGKSPNFLQDFDNFANALSVGVGSIVIGAGKTMRLENFATISGSIATHSASNSAVPVYYRYENVVETFGTTPYGIVAFTYLLENGEVITAADATGSDFVATCVASLPAADYAMEWNGLHIAKPFYDNATLRYQLSLKIDITDICNIYSRKLSTWEMEEKSPLVLGIGWCAIGVPGTISYTNWTTAQYVGQPRRISA